MGVPVEQWPRRARMPKDFGLRRRALACSSGRGLITVKAYVKLGKSAIYGERGAMRAANIGGVNN
jgi:hypothetical protein